MNAVVAVCIVLVLAGALAALRWGHYPIATPWSGDVDTDVAPVEWFWRALWFIDVLLAGAIATGLLVIGPGGRLVMRLLAVTAGDAAQGKLTEADEVVGEITVGGTIGFVLFAGLLGGFAIALLYAGLRKWLPSGRLGALIVGAVFAILFSTRLDPVRPENPDFGIVGPGWVAVTSFFALGVLTVLTFSAVAGRVAKSLPMFDGRLKGIAPYAPLVLLLASVTPAAFVVVASVVCIGLLSHSSFRRLWSHRLVLVGGRMVIAIVTLAFLPAFVMDIAEIL